MAGWSFSERDLKRYPHFDAPLSVEEAIAIATSPDRVARHTFFPFICFEKKYTRFRKQKKERRKKERTIRYAGRADSYIYSRYRHLLSERYEAALEANSLTDNVIAYRKIPVSPGSSGGKCNIHFAKLAFDHIEAAGDCCAIVLDISDFFGSIDHRRLKEVWCRLLDVELLPSDHYAVFKNITRYAEVDRSKLYERLGYMKRDKRGISRFSRSRRNMPYQLCTPEEFHNRIARVNPGEIKLIATNKQQFGIPQGAPISDLLANAYLIDFDCRLAQYVNTRGGLYLRYSDDILIVVPGDGRAGRAAREHVVRLIGKFGKELRIKPEKCSTVRFRRNGKYQICERLPDGRRTDGLEYLGFRYDGVKVYLRNSTLTNLRRKIKRSVRAHAHYLVAKHPGMDEAFLIEQFRISKFMERFGRVMDFEQSKEYRNWTFWSYAAKASSIFGSSGQVIFQQLKGYQASISRLIKQEVRDALAKSSQAPPARSILPPDAARHPPRIGGGKSITPAAPSQSRQHRSSAS